MTAQLQWEDVEGSCSIETFAERARLDPAKLRAQAGVIILPRNTELHTITANVDVFPGVSKELVAALIDGGVEAALYGSGNERRQLVRRGADVVLPVIFFGAGVVLNVSLSVVANWLYDRYVSSRSSQPTLKLEMAEVGAGGKIVRWRRVEGPADAICELIRGEAGKDGTAVAASPTAGSNEKWWRTHCEEQARAAIAVARQLVDEGEHQLADGHPEFAETLFRRALGKLREAVLWEPDKPEHRRYLHQLGVRVHDQFRCRLEFRDNCYWVNCPVALSHHRGGMSIGGTGRVTCSVCGDNLMTCEHIKGRTYDGVVARMVADRCNICGEKQCGHVEGESYDGVQVSGIIEEMQLDHVSFVEEPSDPLAVIHGYSVPKSDMLRDLPEEERDQFRFGATTVYCHHCIVCPQSYRSPDHSSRR